MYPEVSNYLKLILLLYLGWTGISTALRQFRWKTPVNHHYLVRSSRSRSGITGVLTGVWEYFCYELSYLYGKSGLFC